MKDCWRCCQTARTCGSLAGFGAMSSLTDPPGIVMWTPRTVWLAGSLTADSAERTVKATVGMKSSLGLAVDHPGCVPCWVAGL